MNLENLIIIRKSKLSFENTIMAAISMECSSISSELKKFFGYSDDTPTSSAFVQQRDKLKSDAFEYLFHAFTSEMSSNRYKGFKLYAIDGSDVLIPLEKENKTYSYFTNENQGCYHQIHLNAIYNLMSNQYEDAYIEPRRGHNERNAFHQMFERTFVNKIKSEHAHNIDAYHRVHPTFTPYFLNENVKKYHMAFRVVRVRLSNGNYECLLTNLPAETFDIQALKELYRMRWGIETSFRHLKLLLNFQGSIFLT